MVAGYYRHEFKQGESYAIDIDIKDSAGAIDTTGWQGASAIKTLDGTTPVDADNNPIAFTVDFSVSGTVQFSLTPAQTTALPVTRLLYDAKFIDASGAVVYYLEGDVIVHRSYTL